MAHILLMTSGLRGILNTSLAMAGRLQQAGHRVMYACAHDVREPVEAEGLSFRQLPPVNFDPSQRVDLTGAGGPLARVRCEYLKYRNLRSRRTRALASLNLDPFRNLLAEEKPDLLMMDMELHDFIIAGRTSGIPVLQVSQLFCTAKRAGLPPLESTMIPRPGSLKSVLRMELAWKLRQLKQLKSHAREAMKSGFTDRRSILIYYARQTGFPTRQLQQGSFPPPFIHTGLPMVSTTAEELEFPHRKASGMTYIGPMVRMGKRRDSSDTETVAALETLFAQRRQSGKKLILHSGTTMGSRPADLPTGVIQAVKDQEDWILVITTGGKTDPAARQGLPRNVHVFDWIPQSWTLGQADCSINHGGINTLNECLVHRVPMLLHSGGMFDQNGCVARAVFHGIGIAGHSGTDDPGKIRQDLTTLLTHPQFKERIDSIARRYESLEGMSLLETAVQEQLGSHPVSL
jgi:UDP:flavonoid glycosyltransferase YjiC (YdhE family)